MPFLTRTTYLLTLWLTLLACGLPVRSAPAPPKHTRACCAVKTMPCCQSHAATGCALSMRCPCHLTPAQPVIVPDATNFPTIDAAALLTANAFGDFPFLDAPFFGRTSRAPRGSPPTLSSPRAPPFSA